MLLVVNNYFKTWYYSKANVRFGRLLPTNAPQLLLFIRTSKFCVEASLWLPYVVFLEDMFLFLI